MEFLGINVYNEGYAPDQCRSTMKVSELIDYLADLVDYDFEENEAYRDMPVYVRFDNGYSFGSINGYHSNSYGDDDIFTIYDDDEI